MDHKLRHRANELSRVRAIALDRDGTINVDAGYTHRVKDLEFIDGFVDFMAWAASLGLPVSVITNQSGVARGYYDLDAVHRFNAAINTALARFGLKIESFEICPHLPAAGCSCRKPATGMLETLASRYGVAPQDWVVFGDQPSDIECARNFGALGVGVGSKFTTLSATDIVPDFCIDSLGDFSALYERTLSDNSRT